MRTIPTSIELLEIIAEYLRNVVAKKVGSPDNFYLIVAANSLDIVRREIELGPDADARAKERLTALLGTDGKVDHLETLLAEGIADGSIPITDALRDHLLRTTIDEVAIDQPKYASYRRARALLDQADAEGSETTH